MVERNTETKKYYRALSTPDHLRSWYNGIRNSFYNSTAGEWIKKWDETKSENKDEYSLNCYEATFTEKALENFIKYSKIYKSNQTWNTQDLLSASEVDGIYAFDNPLDAYNYGKDSPFGENNIYVEFDGEELGPAPENNGFRVKVIEITWEWYQNEFIKNFNLIQTKD